MAIGPPGRRSEPLHLFPMVGALILAAFAGAALGLLWHAVTAGG